MVLFTCNLDRIRIHGVLFICHADSIRIHLVLSVSLVNSIRSNVVLLICHVCVFHMSCGQYHVGLFIQDFPFRS